MIAYDPEHAPDPEEWLAMDEMVRISAVQKFHRKARIKLPNAKAHAIFHAIVENQIAMQHDPVMRAMARLAQQGLSRHDCLHAVGWVLACHMHRLTTTGRGTPSSAVKAQYDEAIERLTADSWRSQVEE